MGNVVLVACTNVGRAMIEAIKTSDALRGVHLAGVVNLKPEAAISKANYDTYIDLVVKYGLNIYYCENINEKECYKFIKSCDPDIIIQSGWSQKFSQDILHIPQYGCIGEHPAPLPKGRGAACINWAIINGEREWGDTFFRMEMNYDTGEIFSQEKFIIEPYDDVKTVYDKVAKASVNAIEKHLEDWAKGKLAGRKQDDLNASHYPKRKPSDGLLDFSKSSLDIYNAIRAQTRPYPGAFFEVNASGGAVRKIYVWEARLGESPEPFEVAVNCGDGKRIILRRVQQEGKPEMWARDFFDEYPEINKSINGQTGISAQ